MKLFHVFILISAIGMYSFTKYDNEVQGNSRLPYNLSDPIKSLKLPDILHEISGMTDIDENKFACVQDEKGIIFIFDLVTNSITQEFKFGEDGDYEGITRVGETIYILNSDGNLIKVEGLLSGKIKTKKFETGIPASNNEALCYDAAHNRLLIGCKSKPGKGKEFKDVRVVYGFDLKTEKLSKEPVYEFSVSSVISYAKKHGIELPTKTNKKTNVKKVNLSFGISGISIHPKTGELYILSAVDYSLFVYDKHSELKYMVRLNPTQFRQAEGITFNAAGDLLISNEGRNHHPVIYQFKYLDL